MGNMTNEYASTITSMRKTLKKTKIRVAEGSVVRWTGSSRYTYVAVFVNNMWYTTGGNYYVAKTMTHDEFIAYLSSADVSNIEVAESFASIDV